MNMTKTEIAAGCYTVLVACLRGKETGLNGVPNGHLYSQLMGAMDFEHYTSLIELMKSSGLITETGHLLQSTPKGETMFAQLHAIYSEVAVKKEGA